MMTGTLAAHSSAPAAGAERVLVLQVDLARSQRRLSGTGDMPSDASAPVETGLPAISHTPPMARAPQNTIVPGGTIITHTTWITTGSPYLVQGNLTVGSGVTLTVEPGVEVRFATSTWLSMAANGTLLAVGTVTRPITFTSHAATPAAGDWYYHRPQANSRLPLAYCDLGYGGRDSTNGL